MKKVVSLFFILILSLLFTTSALASVHSYGTLTPETATMTVGQTLQLTLVPNDQVISVENKGFFSSNTEVATVNDNGVVTAVGVGEVRIDCEFSPIIPGYPSAVMSFTPPCTITVTAAPEPPEGDYTTIYRLYNPIDGEHLFTSSELEVSTLTTQDNWRSEGVGWYAPIEGTPVYRLYNPELHNHLYTTDTLEVEYLTANEGWVKDFNGEPIFYAGGDNPIYRLYNPGLNGAHLLTTNQNEFNVLPADGWIQEGIAFNALAVGN